MQAEDPRVFSPQHFENHDNPRVHYEETAHELWRQTSGDIARFVAGVGSGGTLQGVGRYLKEHKPDVRIVAVEPKNVSALLGHEPGLHQIQGIGDGFIPEILDVSMVDEVVEITDEQVIETTRELGRKYGLLVGISSGANVCAARQMAAKMPGNIATVLPDRAERYFSTALNGAYVNHSANRQCIRPRFTWGECLHFKGMAALALSIFKGPLRRIASTSSNGRSSFHFPMTCSR
jgi:cysteine synthase A